MSFYKETSCSRYSTKDYKTEMENVICTSGAFPRCCDNTTMLMRVSGLLLSYKAKKKRNNNISSDFAWLQKSSIRIHYSLWFTLYTCIVQQSIYSADLATGRERQLMTGKRTERTKHDFRFPVCRSAIGQASCLICACRRQLTFPFCC